MTSTARPEPTTTAQPATDSTPSPRRACRCGDTDEPGYPELDARTLPHSIRHAAILGALATVHPGAGLILIAPHNPLPLLDQVHREHPGRYTVEYLERGPHTWRVTFTHRAGTGTGPHA